MGRRMSHFSRIDVVSKTPKMLKASCALEDSVYNLTRPVKSLRVEVNNDERRWEPRSPAMAAGITDHIWTIDEIMMTLDKLILKRF
jgi:hypothetical protein